MTNGVHQKNNQIKKWPFPALLIISLLVLLHCSNKRPANGTLASDWIKDSTTYFTLQAQKGVRSQDRLQQLGKKLETVQEELLVLLHEVQPQKLAVYFLKDRETLTSYTGFPANGYTDTERGIIYFVDKAPFHLALRHEVMHALSWRLWGTPKGYWLSEGLAVYTSGTCGGYNLHSLAQAIAKNGGLQSFTNLTDSFDFRSLEPSLQAASMVQYIVETYSINALKRFWQKGWQEAPSIVGVSTAELEKRWKYFIGQQRFERAIDWKVIKGSGCE